MFAVNIAVAIVSEITRGAMFAPNALVGALLLAWIPFDLSPVYVALYTAWNATFTYGLGYSWSTRLILVPPIVASILLGSCNFWLPARCVSLVLNMVLRATETSDFYTPGKTFITQARPQPDPRVYLAMALCTSCFAACYAASGDRGTP